MLLNSTFSKIFLILFLLASLLSRGYSAKVLSTPWAFHSEYCGFSSWLSGTSQITCTFTTPQSDVVRHELSLAELNKPTNIDLRFRAYSWLSTAPSTSASIRITNFQSATIKLGFFLIVIKNQPITKYIDFITMYAPIGSANISDSSNTVRYYYVDGDIHALTLMTGTDLNNLKIVPFINSYSLILNSAITNTAGSEYQCMFEFNHQIVTSPNIIRMKVTIQPTISMSQFVGSMLLVNIQQIQSEKSAYLSNPTLTATDCLSQQFTIGNTTAGKLAVASFQTAFADFGTSFNKKCFLGFQKISYTRLTQFSFQLGKNSYNNYDKYSQGLASTSTGLIPQITIDFFCYGVGKDCSDSSIYYDMIDFQCYTPSTCPLPVPGPGNTWPHTNKCPWCQQLICSSCTPSNRSECFSCEVGSNSFINTVTKQCDCNPGYYFVYSVLAPVTWNSATTTAYTCAFNCTFQYPGCDLNQCDATQCLQCLSNYMFVYPSFSPRQCYKCSNMQANCFQCAVMNFCSTCYEGYYLVPISSPTNVSIQIGRSCYPCLLNCKQCTGNTVCTACFSGYQLASSNSQCVCNATLANLLNCKTCTINTTCTSCDTGFYISSITGLCQPCTNIHPQCKTCSSQNICTKCTTGYGIDPATVTGKVICSVCNKIVSNCDDCLQISNCLHCTTSYGLAAPLQCMYCELLKVPGCIECTIISAPCTKCNSTSFLLNGTCFFCPIYHNLCISCQANTALQTLQCIQCQHGYYVGLSIITSRNQCLPCPEAMYKCLECSSSTFCTKCQFPNKLGTTNQCTQCEFPYVNYDGICMKLAGCSNALQTSPGIMACLACNDTLHFVFQPTSNNCICGRGYYEAIAPQPDQKCQPICGDGIFIKPDEQCDDKNLIDYDGCNRHCKEEDYFDCGQASPSQCVLIRDFTKFQFTYAQRIDSENKGILYFSIEPSQVGLTFMDWSKLITINFASKAINASFLSYIYSIDTGMLKVYFPYSETVENSLLNYEVKLDPKKIKSTQSSFKEVCQVKGANFPLIVENIVLLEHSRYIQIIVLVLSVLALVQFYVGSYLGKMIGLETIQIFQFVGFARLLVFTKNTTLLNAFNDLKYSSSGFSNPKVLFGTEQVSENQLISQEFNKIDIQKYYLLNINFWLIPIIFVVLAYLVVSIRKWFEWRTLSEQKQPSAKYKYVLTRRSVQYIYEQCIFPQVMMIGMLVYFNNLLYLLANDSTTDSKISPLEMQSMAFQTLSQYAISAILAFQVMSSLKQFIRPQSQYVHLLSLRQKYELDENSPHRPNYHSLYIFVYFMYYFILYLIMSLDVEVESFTYSLQITIALTVVYLVFICFWSPYFGIVKIHNTFLKINHGIATTVLVIYQVFNRYNSISPITYIILAYVIMGLLFIVLLGGYVRIYIEHLYRKKLSFKIQNGKGQVTLVEEEQIMKRMTKKQRTQELLINNKFTFKNQLAELKKSYQVTIGSNSIPDKKLTKQQETFFINQIKEEFKQKSYLYRDFWGNNKINESLVEQIDKPTQLMNLSKDQAQINKNEPIESNPMAQKQLPTKSKSKHSAQEKQTLKKLKIKLRSQLIQMGQDE